LTFVSYIFQAHEVSKILDASHEALCELWAQLVANYKQLVISLFHISSDNICENMKQIN